jgi:phosphohistidine phosphatase SixA
MLGRIAETSWRKTFCVSSGKKRRDRRRFVDEADPELVEEDSAALAAALRRVLDSLPDGGRALVVGHSPTNEAAVLGLAGEIVAPISKGGGVLVVEEDGARPSREARLRKPEALVVRS